MSFGIHVEPRRAVEAWRHVRTHLGILLGVDTLAAHRILIGKRAEIVLERQSQTLQEIHHEKALQLLDELWFRNFY